MQTATVTELEKRLSYFMEEVNNSHDPLYVVGDKNKVVILSEDDWNSYQETIYLLTSRNNSDRLLQAVVSNDFISFDSIKDMKNEIGV